MQCYCMTVKSLRRDDDVIAQWIMLENVFVLEGIYSEVLRDEVS